MRARGSSRGPATWGASRSGLGSGTTRPSRHRARGSMRRRSVEDRAGIVGRLLQGVDEPLLWMEVYENVRDPQRFEATIGDLLAARRFAAFLALGSERRTERFVAPSL